MSSSTFELPSWGLPQNMEIDNKYKRKKGGKEGLSSGPVFVKAGDEDSSEEEGAKAAKKQITETLAATGSASHKELPKLWQTLVLALSSLSLASSQGLREVVGAVFLTFIAPATSPPVVEMTLAGQKYHQHHQQDSPPDIGPPFLHIYLALLQAIMKHLHQLPEEIKTYLAKYWQETIRVVDRSALALDIQYCRCKPTYHEKGKQPSHYKVQVRVREVELENAIRIAILSFEGCSQKLGAAPRSGLEREVQRLVDQARKGSKKK